MAYWHILGRDDRIRQYVKSREGHRGCPWCRSWFAPSVKGIDTVLCKCTSAMPSITQEWCPRPSLAIIHHWASEALLL